MAELFTGVFTLIGVKLNRGGVEILQQYALWTVMQNSNVSTKKASDIAIAIDVMDILYKNDVDIFCLVSNDSDFTRLAIRLRESGKYIVIMGGEKIPHSLQSAGDKFEKLLSNKVQINKVPLHTVNIKNQNTIQKQIISPKKLASRTEIKEIIIKYISSAPNNQIGLFELKKIILQHIPNFDYRDYGVDKFSKFLWTFPIFKLSCNNFVSLNNIRDQNEKSIIDLINQSPDKKISLRMLHSQLVQLIPNYRYPRYNIEFIKHIKSFENILIESSGNNDGVRYIKIEN